MKTLCQFETSVDGDMVTIKAKIVNRAYPSPMMHNTSTHMDNDNPRWITHAQMSNHTLVAKLPPSGKGVGVAIDLEDFIVGIARVVEPAMCPPDDAAPKPSTQPAPVNPPLEGAAK